MSVVVAAGYGISYHHHGPGSQPSVQMHQLENNPTYMLQDTAKYFWLKVKLRVTC